MDAQLMDFLQRTKERVHLPALLRLFTQV